MAILYVAFTKVLLDSVLMESSSHSTRWNNLVPRKVNSIFLFPVRYWFLFGIDKITSWWDVDIPINCSITNMINWSNNLKIDVETKRNCDAVVMVTFWSIWSYRNKMVFDLVKPRKDMIFDDIRSFAYFWVKNRRRNCKFD
uniref:Reverse transcriptase zinc-binding domain-containing protein n=1 Tax=Lactuca sativa TaxID=4236 RepID=A0A9R1UEZ0_LACSA|nr:hypothetical protein LSAT_V11C900489320 [Lactuca sativa]